MGKVVRLEGPRQVSVVEEADPALDKDDVRIRTIATGISAGTELAAYRGTNPFLSKHWDPEQRLFSSGPATLVYPLDGWGYEEVGRIVETGADVNAVRVGQVVWGSWGHRTTAVVSEEYAAARVLDGDADPVVGIFSRIGAIALNAMLDADIHVGETVVVFGLGVPGQLVVQLARLNGGEVVAVDSHRSRLDLASELGASFTLPANEGPIAEKVRELTDGRGADVAIEVSGSYEALQEATRTAAYGGRVVAAGFYQGTGTSLALGEEFHHNRIEIVSSQISGVAPSAQYRWDQNRLSRTVIGLVSAGRLNTSRLITHRVPIIEAAEAFRMLDESSDQVLQVVLDVDEDYAQ